MPGLSPPSLQDIVSLDPDALRAMSLQDLMKMMRGFGLSTLGIENEAEALNRLIERAAISPLGA